MCRNEKSNMRKRNAHIKQNNELVELKFLFDAYQKRSTGRESLGRSQRHEKVS